MQTACSLIDRSPPALVVPWSQKKSNAGWPLSSGAYRPWLQAELTPLLHAEGLRVRTNGVDGDRGQRRREVREEVEPITQAKKEFVLTSQAEFMESKPLGSQCPVLPDTNIEEQHLMTLRQVLPGVCEVWSNSRARAKSDKYLRLKFKVKC